MNSGGAIAVIAVALVGTVTWCVQNKKQEKEEERDARVLHKKVKTFLQLEEKKQRKKEMTTKEESLFNQLGQDEQVQEAIKNSQNWSDPDAINSGITRLNAQLAKQTSTDQIPLLKEDNGAEVIGAINTILSKSDSKIIKKQLLQLQRRVQTYQKRA